MPSSQEWRRVLRAAQAARGAAYLGPRTAARAAAVVLAVAPHPTRLATACVLAAQSAKNEFQTDTSTLWRELEATDRLRQEMMRLAPIRHIRRVAGIPYEPLPVEAAKAVPILELLQRYGHHPRRVGAEWVMVCPFHDDRRPSLRVNAPKGRWYCDVCATGGDGISYVMQRKGLDFAAAVREVAA